MTSGSLASLTEKRAAPATITDPSIKLESELLSLAYSLQGQGLQASSVGRVNVIRRALEAFQDSARFGDLDKTVLLIREDCNFLSL